MNGLVGGGALDASLNLHQAVENNQGYSGKGRRP